MFLAFVIETSKHNLWTAGAISWAGALLIYVWKLYCWSTQERCLYVPLNVHVHVCVASAARIRDISRIQCVKPEICTFNRDCDGLIVNLFSMTIDILYCVFIVKHWQRGDTQPHAFSNAFSVPEVVFICSFLASCAVLSCRYVDDTKAMEMDGTQPNSRQVLICLLSAISQSFLFELSRVCCSSLEYFLKHSVEAYSLLESQKMTCTLINTPQTLACGVRSGLELDSGSILRASFHHEWDRCLISKTIVPYFNDARRNGELKNNRCTNPYTRLIPGCVSSLNLWQTSLFVHTISWVRAWPSIS